MKLVFGSCSCEFSVAKFALVRLARHRGGPLEEHFDDYASGRVAWLGYEYCFFPGLVLKVRVSRVCHL